MDQMVLETQKWLNRTYSSHSGFNQVIENGKTGWATIYGLRRALQIEIGITVPSDNFGNQTYTLCPAINQGSSGNLVYIVQGGLWCKGYSPGGFNGNYGPGTYTAVKKLKADMGFPTATGNMNRDIMKALLDMSAFVLLPGGTPQIRNIQQLLNYNYYDYYQIAPCDGLYTRDMNKMLIYALQYEEGIPKGSATGTWGPSTIAKCPTLYFAEKSPFIRIVRYGLVCNGVAVDINADIVVEANDDRYDEHLEQAVIEFANTLRLQRPNKVINYTIIKSLLSSNGDTNRSAEGCDTATRLDLSKIQTLKSYGYKIVGRYLTKVAGGLDKNMTIEEVKLILGNGLKIFPIFQEYGGGNSAFSISAGTRNAYSAHDSAEALGIPFGTTIYFAVDYDPQTAEIKNYIVPYFKAIQNVFNIKYKRTYGLGVYGTRNVCRILKEESDINIDGLFVSDASYGFSGNLGFAMPSFWDFDQFKTDLMVGIGEGAVGIDKVAVFGSSSGFNHIDNHDTALDKVCKTLQELYFAAMSYTYNDRVKSNILVVRYLREKNSSYKGTLWNLTGGEADSNFAKTADEINQAHDFKFNDPKTGQEYDFYHLMATLSACTHITKIPQFDINWDILDPIVDVLSGWGGDLTTFGYDIQEYAQKQEDKDYQDYANKLICGAVGTSSFTLVDYIADIDADNIAFMLEKEGIAEAFYEYFMKYDGEKANNRIDIFVNQSYENLGAFKTAIDTFSAGVIPEPYLDPFAYIKSLIVPDGVIVRPEYNQAAANAFKNFVTNEVLGNV